jgi:hypothetical protein
VQFLVVVEAVEDLLLSLVPDRAGVVEDKPSLFFSFDLRVALVEQSADHFLGVVGIHLAAEGFEIECFSGRHNYPVYRDADYIERRYIGSVLKGTGFIVKGAVFSVKGTGFIVKGTVFTGNGKTPSKSLF